MNSFLKKLFCWYQANARDFPFRRTKDPYLIWLSEIIMQQTRIEQGVPYYDKFVRVFPGVYDLAGASEEDVLKQWQGLGYYSRARNLHSTANEIVEKYAGRFPETYEGLRSLKGVGDYTAAAIASVCFGLPHPVADGNVIRFITRHFGITGPVDKAGVKKEIMDVLTKLMGDVSGFVGSSSATELMRPTVARIFTPPLRSRFAEPDAACVKCFAPIKPSQGGDPASGTDAADLPTNPSTSNFATSLLRHFATYTGPGLFNQAMIEFGAMYCIPRNPDCKACIFANSCYALKHTMVGQLPVKKQQQALKQRYFNYLVISVKGSDGLYFGKRSGNDIWKGLYEFKLIETKEAVSPQKLKSSPEWKKLFGRSAVDIVSHTGDIIHILSHQKIITRFYKLEIKKPSETFGMLVQAEKIPGLPIARIIEKYFEMYPLVGYSME
jgi:adenine-specific DNA glycosylase